MNQTVSLAVPDGTHPLFLAARGIQDAAKAVAEVKDQQSLELASGFLQQVKGRISELTEMRLSLTRPIDETKKRIMALFGVPILKYEEAERTVKRGVQTHLDAERDKARAAAESARKLQEQEAERIRIEAEKKAKRTKDPEKKDAILANAAVAAQQAVAPIATAAPPTAAGIQSRENWKAEGFDLDATIKAAAAGDSLARSCLCYNEKVLGSNARSLHADFKVAGVRCWSETGIASSRG